MVSDQGFGKPTARRYSAEEKAAAVRMVRTLRAELGTEHGTVHRVATQLGYGVESVRMWVKQADIDDGTVAGVSTAEARRMRELEQEVRELRRANEILKRAASFFGAELVWVTDLTFVPTWAGVAYVCFIIDAYSRMIVGWRCASHMRTEMVLDAIEMARWGRGTHHDDLRCHSDAGSQFTSIRYGERLAEIGATPSIGTVGDSYDNALAETVNGYYKTELVRGPTRPGPWRTVEDLELATLGWVHWHNTQRLHGYLHDIPPAEFENAFYADQARRDQPVGIK